MSVVTDPREEIEIRIRVLSPTTSAVIEELNVIMRSNKEPLDKLIEKSLKLKSDLLIENKEKKS